MTSHGDAHLAGPPLSAGSHLGRQRHEFRPLFGKCHEGRAVPVRFSPRPRRSRSAFALPRADRHGLARLSARRAAGPDLRLSRRRAVQAGRRASLQPEQGPARSLCQGDRPRDALGRRDVGLQAGRSAGRPVVRRARQRRVRPAGGRGRRGLHLGRRPAAADSLEQDVIYEMHVKGFTQAASRRAGEAARHLRGPGSDAGDPLSQDAGHHGRRAAAGARSRRRPAPGRSRAGELLGLQHARVSSPRSRAMPRSPARPTRCANSRRWSATCTRPASK